MVKAIASYLFGSDDEPPVIFSPYAMEQYAGDLVADANNANSPTPGKQEASEEAADYWEDDTSTLRYKFPALVYMSNWMSVGKNVYNHGDSGPHIWLYCCKPGEFLERVREEEEAQDHSGEPAEASGAIIDDTPILGSRV